jgi:putative membrane protein
VAPLDFLSECKIAWPPSIGGGQGRRWSMTWNSAPPTRSPVPQLSLTGTPKSTLRCDLHANWTQVRIRRAILHPLELRYLPKEKETRMPIKDSQTSARIGALDRYGFLKSSAARAGIAFVALALFAGSQCGRALAADSSSGRSRSEGLAAVDYNFVAQANLGAPFQIDSGRVAEAKATTQEIRDYAHLMVITHIPVVDALNNILQQKNIKTPPNPLLNGAYRAMVASLKVEDGAALDRDYIEGQVQYQKGNAALFRNEIENGYDADLKQFARATLPKIEDHLERALKLAKDERGRAAPQ